MSARARASARRATLLIDAWLILTDGRAQLPRRPAVVLGRLVINGPFQRGWWKVDKKTRTETGDEDLALAVGELRQDLDPGNIIHIFILPVKGLGGGKARTYLAWVRAMRLRQHRNGCPL